MRDALGKDRGCEREEERKRKKGRKAAHRQKQRLSSSGLVAGIRHHGTILHVSNRYSMLVEEQHGHTYPDQDQDQDQHQDHDVK